MRFVIAPDSYKGSLSSREVGAIMAAAIRREIPQAEIDVFPMADGGEGTVEALVGACGGRSEEIVVHGPLEPGAAALIGLIEQDGEPVYVIETANICGLPMIPADRRDPYAATSRGLGEAIAHALDRGARRLIVGLGGSAVNDGGIGMLTALGVRFADRDGRLLEGKGGDLLRIAAVDWSGLDPRLAACEITAASDVTSPLTGPAGASLVFGPQKGASPAQAAELDAAMAAYAALLELPGEPSVGANRAVEASSAVEDGEIRLSGAESDKAGANGQRLSERPGAGAAGGLGFALLRLGARIESGAEVAARATGLKKRIAGAHWVLTGEGRTDAQTLSGKLPFRVAEWAAAEGVPAILVSGGLGPDIEPLYETFAAVFPIVGRPSTLDECLAEAEDNLARTARNVARLIKTKT
ncbi:glycerate kinase [Cohnella hashimotonis]|uniref:Glycerate kinase n=1 Tax=Cohnella hashimotonis TaxID=2826895 RepID=A0ABT6TVJ2_9BACL|nr:glycerate kinase [Cohnella hashimotonis]MDI4649974.1 glycerate kinase [Cohnella hashimotonis]